MSKNLSERLRELRGNESQEAFAKRIGTKQTSYSSWERGEKDPSASAIVLIASRLGVSSDWLLGLSDATGALASGERERLEGRVRELEGALHDAEVSIRTLRETILEGNFAPSSFPLSSLRPAAPSRRHPAP